MRKRVAAMTAVLALAAPAAAHAGFKEQVKVLWSVHGAAGSGSFGWAVSALGDVDRDRRGDVIVGEPFAGGGTTWVYSGATGEQLYRLHEDAGDAQGYAIADAGDVDRDHYADIISGAPQYGSTPGKAYLYSGRDGSLLHTFTAAVEGDSFGAAVSGTGDLDGDHVADLLIGAPTGGIGGSAYVYSGHTYALLYKLDAFDAGDSFGNGTGFTRDLDGDHVNDLVIGAGLAGPGSGAGGGAAYVFSGSCGQRLFDLAPPPAAAQFGTFFVAGVGDVDRDRVPDVYAGDYAAGGGAGFAGVYSGADGARLLAFSGDPGDGVGPGRGAGDVDDDHVPDLSIGSWTNSDGGTQAGRVQLFSGAGGALLRTITSTSAGENFGFDAVGVGDVDHDHVDDLFASGASGDNVYMIAGKPS